MGFLGGIGNIVSKVLPKVIPVVQNIVSSPIGQFGIDILKQLASSVFSKDGKGGVFSENFQLTLPNPLSKLNGLLGNIGKTVTSIADFMSRIGDFLQGKRTLEDGQEVNVPRLGDRAATTASAAASTAADIAAGKYNETIAKATSASTASTSSASTATSVSAGAGAGAIDRISDAAFSTALSPAQRKILDKAKAGGADETQLAQMEAQMQMTNLQNLMTFISNIMRIMADTQKSIIANIR